MTMEPMSIYGDIPTNSLINVYFPLEFLIQWSVSHQFCISPISFIIVIVAMAQGVIDLHVAFTYWVVATGITLKCIGWCWR